MPHPIRMDILPEEKPEGVITAGPADTRVTVTNVPASKEPKLTQFQMPLLQSPSPQLLLVF